MTTSTAVADPFWKVAGIDFRNLIWCAIAIGIMLTYEISERRAYEIRAELERRRGKLGSAATVESPR